jgi:transmembrane sensor
MITGHGPRRHVPQDAVPAVPSTPYSTAVGETRQITLADGTRVTLNTNTRLYVSFSQRAREVMLERGEATFDVASPATAPPFNVVAGQRTFQAQAHAVQRAYPAG